MKSEQAGRAPNMGEYFKKMEKTAWKLKWCPRRRAPVSPGGQKCLIAQKRQSLQKLERACSEARSQQNAPYIHTSTTRSRLQRRRAGSCNNMNGDATSSTALEEKAVESLVSLSNAPCFEHGVSRQDQSNHLATAPSGIDVLPVCGGNRSAVTKPCLVISFLIHLT